MQKTMNLKKIFVICAVTVFAVASQIPAFAVDVSVFSDVAASNTNYEAIKYLKDGGVVVGYSDGQYKPKNHINRAEFLKIVMESSDYEFSGLNCYPDVKNEWYAKYVCKATKLGFVKGYDDGYFRPEKEINFAEASKIVANVLGLALGDEGDTWYVKYVSAIEAYKGIPESISSFAHNITRGEMAEIIWRIKQEPSQVSYVTYDGLERREEAVASDGGLLKFESCIDLKNYFVEKAVSQSDLYDGMMIMEEMSVPMATSPDSETKSGEEEQSIEPLALSEDRAEYSTTNIQVEGVDEADIIKTDGEYIYIVKGGNIRVVKAYPPAQMQELDAVDFGDEEAIYPDEMYVDEDRLIVVANSYGYPIEPMEVENNERYWYGGEPVTHLYIFDISDKADISLMRTLDFEGDYSSSRKVDDMVYLVVNKTEYVYGLSEDINEDDIIPLYKDSKSGSVEPVSRCGDIWYWPTESTEYLIVAGVSVNESDAEISKQVVLGSSGSIYASRENLYVAEVIYGWDWLWTAKGVTNQDDKEKTIIHKFGLGSNIEYLGNSSVKGTILNQFSMDEYKGNFRIATTLGDVWDTENLSQNNLYILDSNLNLTGSIEGIAPGEKIYSVRFMGDRAYMVTFKKVDPFFVIDVSDPGDPRILGKLKIPGFSDYLHPYDENHIIGFGKEAIDASEEQISARNLDFAWYQGLKVAMFDVTDVNNPVELYKVVIGDRGTDSELLHNHKALLFDKDKGIIAFPVMLAEVSESLKNNPNTPAETYGDYVYQGAYIYNVSLENGFDFRGRITHYDENEVAEKAGYYWSGDKNIQRILYIGDYFYTVSQVIVKANGMENLEDVSAVELKD